MPMTWKGTMSEPECYVCGTTNEILKLHGEPESGFLLCQECEDKADSILTGSE